MQSFQKLITLPDHNFLISMQQKLISSIYLLINLNDTNDTFHNGQFLIFVCSQYQIGTSLTTHISDLNLLTKDDKILKVDS